MKPGCYRGDKQSKQRTNLFTRVRDFIQYARLMKHFLDYCDRKQHKTMLAKKDNSCSSLCTAYCAYSPHNTVISVFTVTK